MYVSHFKGWSQPKSNKEVSESCRKLIWLHSHKDWHELKKKKKNSVLCIFCVKEVCVKRKMLQKTCDVTKGFDSPQFLLPNLHPQAGVAFK